MFGWLIGAIAVTAVAAVINVFSDNEKKRQKKLEENYKEYQAKAVKKNQEAEENYYQTIRSMQNASAETLYAMRQRLLAEKKARNQTAYDTVVECLKQQMDEAKKKKVEDKQAKLAKRMLKLSDAIRVKSSKSIMDSKRELASDNKRMSIDSLRDEVSNSPFEIL